jgi:hypothetical protein
MSARRKRKRRSDGSFVMLPTRVMNSSAWRAMTPGPKVLWIELRKYLRNDRLNNGALYMSCRKAADAIGVTTTTIVHWYAEIEHYGFVRKTGEGFLGAEGRGIAARYRFTDLAYGSHGPTLDFEKWDGVRFTYTPRRPGRKKQNPVLVSHTPRVSFSHRGKGGDAGSLCTTFSHIDSAPRCIDSSHGSRLPSPVSAKAQVQGSSTVRAPASHAGDAGSSPAPVARLRHSHNGAMGVTVANPIDDKLRRLKLQRWSTPKISPPGRKGDRQ